MNINADIFQSHQIKIAKQTLKMSDIGASIMGGMTKDEAKEILNRHRYRNRYHNRNRN